MFKRSLLWSLLALSAWLYVGCGSGSDTPPPPPVAEFSLETTTVTFNASETDAIPPAKNVNGSIINATSTVYLFIARTDVGISDATVALTGQTTGQITITPKSPALLGAGTYQDTIIVDAYLDAARTRRISGSPKTITVTYTVTATLPSSFTLTPGSLSFLDLGDIDPAPSNQIVNVTDIAPNVYLFAAPAVQSVTSAVFQSTGTTTGEVQIAFASPADLGPGIYLGDVNVWACSDAAGAHEIPGSRQAIGVTYHVHAASAPAQGTEMIRNGNFSAGLGFWKNWSQNGGAGFIAIVNGELKLTVTAIGNFPSDVQINCLSSLHCVQGRNYRLSFDARADANRNLGTTINENGHELTGDNFPYSAHQYKNHPITTANSTCTMEFTMPVTNTDAALLFLAGESMDTLYIDNVSFVEIP